MRGRIKELVPIGTKRTIKVFLWFPRWMQIPRKYAGQWRWLERTAIIQEYRGRVFGWRDWVWAEARPEAGREAGDE